MADYYASEFNHMFGKWECVDGRLAVTPLEAADNSWGEAKLDGRKRTVVVEQSKLVDDRYEVISSASTGGIFTMDEPFGVSFVVDDLLFPKN